MFLAVQYYRAPFPHAKRWADDFSRIRDAGIHAVQLWALWGWIEAEPGRYNYDDYDQLMALAEKKGLKVVLSTIAEIHPFWIHRLVSDSHMVDHTGRQVISSCRRECNVGLTPGGCFDNPRVAELMGNFLTDIAARYASARHLIGWDSWNETRWNVNAHGMVCYCQHSLREFRAWLDRSHGGLAGVNADWQRRYADWQDVYPGIHTNYTYTECMEFARWLAVRSANHARFRCQAIRKGDAGHIISAHCGTPAIHSYGGQFEPTLNRGNDWDLADQLDGFGCSHFPFWGDGFDEEGFGVRVEAIRSANRGKTLWVSELHGGSSRDDIVAHRSVPAGPQQRWVANGMARGAKAVIFWCWRDEIFGPESSGFGLDGWDGLADDRLAAMAKTGKFIDANTALIDSYRPDPAKVGVMFSPDNYFLYWAQSGSARKPGDSLLGYMEAIERLRIPYEVVESHHMATLDGLDVLLLPWSLCLDDAAWAAVLKFIRRGGTVLTEGETNSFDPMGFYRYPDERPFMKAIGVHDLGRRKVNLPYAMAVESPSGDFDLPLDDFITPLVVTGAAEVLARDAANQPLLVRKTVGDGVVYVLGSFSGIGYHKQHSEGLEKLVGMVCNGAGVQADFDVDAGDGNRLLQWRTGTCPSSKRSAKTSGASRLLWIINGGPERHVTVTDRAGLFAGKTVATELTTGAKIAITKAANQKQAELTVPDGGFVVLKW